MPRPATPGKLSMVSLVLLLVIWATCILAAPPVAADNEDPGNGGEDPIPGGLDPGRHLLPTWTEILVGFYVLAVP